MNLGNESETLEFKKTTAELKKSMESISAMLNKHGVGTIYFGIKPNGEVSGQDVSELSLRDISRAIYESIKPQIYPVVDDIVIENKHVIKVEFNGEETPYSAYGKYYLRTADEDREVSPAVLKTFFVSNEYKDKWEKAQTEFKESDCDKKAIKAFVDNAIKAGRIPNGRYSAISVLKRFGLVKGEFLNNAGNTLFGKNHPVALKTAVFATEERLTFLDMKLYEDNVLNLLQIAEEYILKNIRWRIEIAGLERNEIPEIPVAVVREVIANSFAHSQYNSNTYHEICVHPNKIVIYSPGSYASPYKPEEYVKRPLQSSIRNALISRILYLNKSIEQFGSGFKRIDSLCKDAGVKYSYETSELGFSFILYRTPINNVTGNVTVNVTVNKTEEAVLALLRIHSDYTREQLAESTAKTVRTIQRVLNSLKEKNLIERKGSNKDGIWVVL